MCYGMMDCCVLYWRMLGKRTRDRTQIIDNLLEKKNYVDLKKAAENRSVWRTVRRDCHIPAPQANNWMNEILRHLRINLTLGFEDDYSYSFRVFCRTDNFKWDLALTCLILSTRRWESHKAVFAITVCYQNKFSSQIPIPRSWMFALCWWFWDLLPF